ncbi:MAG: CDP-alcohol phosphatidyltransferase family protein [Planctomycetes bacterium]|nr:CDP-alcohol phosphatidyltransferase family protein [Planctomycetota bacterium]MBL7107402.1 CDP-alcohol phosphatidyltransferase family protein [Phycisphaerae bacterium]
MNTQNFNGDKKAPMKSLLAKCERKFIESSITKFPPWIQGYHLTLMTIPLSIGLIAFGYLASNNLNWLWLSSLMLFLQWFTDSFDGALGRHRDTGIPKWGFYMDHFLDFVFMSSVFLGYSFLFDGLNKTLIFFMVPAFGCLMVSSFLAFGATGEFKITYLRTGPTEVRASFIILNILITILDTGFLEKTLIYIFIIFFTALCVVIYRTQKYIWKIDMQSKR